jgi:hypothetical protein
MISSFDLSKQLFDSSSQETILMNYWLCTCFAALLVIAWRYHVNYYSIKVSRTVINATFPKLLMGHSTAYLLMQLTEGLGSLDKIRYCLGEILRHDRKQGFPHSGVVCVEPSDLFLREHALLHQVGADGDQGHGL